MVPDVRERRPGVNGGGARHRERTVDEDVEPRRRGVGLAEATTGRQGPPTGQGDRDEEGEHGVRRGQGDGVPLDQGEHPHADLNESTDPY
jgi:hypothetical protein